MKNGRTEKEKRRGVGEAVVLRVHSFAGKFAENKDEAGRQRDKIILPKLEKNIRVILDYENVESTTQSFTHALISEALRRHGADAALELLIFRNCNNEVKKIISIVVEYMQRRLDQ